MDRGSGHPLENHQLLYCFLRNTGTSNLTEGVKYVDNLKKKFRSLPEGISGSVHENDCNIKRFSLSGPLLKY